MPLQEVPLTPAMDASELLGCFEQLDTRCGGWCKWLVVPAKPPEETCLNVAVAWPSFETCTPGSLGPNCVGQG